MIHWRFSSTSYDFLKMKYSIATKLTIVIFRKEYYLYFTNIKKMLVQRVLLLRTIIFRESFIMNKDISERNPRIYWDFQCKIKK